MPCRAAPRRCTGCSTPPAVWSLAATDATEADGTRARDGPFSGTSVDVSAADWRKRGLCGGVADRSRLLQRGGGAPGPVGCSLPAALEAGSPLRVGRYAVPAAEESRATGHLPAASDPASSLRAVPPGAGHLRAGLEPRDLPGPTPHYRQ